MKKTINASSILIPHKSLNEVLEDHRLASLGDTYVNFVYSLALSQKNRKPIGVKVKGSILAEALRRAGLREHVSSSMSCHDLADAVEALLVYSWLNECVTLNESVKMLVESDDPIEGLRQLLERIKSRITLS
ncbi:hypothetical protein A3K79_02250 [Candidatus Bathyarchaeota archaeon RBG_13_46_16b]|nr:MAG: hypothetical protein A3K79_02250 [Candidatus Bathyarchaeota archaeon RBG_13_46_16b]